MIKTTCTQNRDKTQFIGKAIVTHNRQYLYSVYSNITRTNKVDALQDAEQVKKEILESCE
jgi:hypothetical protein